MTDRELLEFAAKAAGIDIPKKLSPWVHYSDTRGFEKLNMDGSAVKWRWNPLTDDGDALRLAVKLRFTVAVRPHEIEVFSEASGECLASIHTQDCAPLEATRYAITSAAAAIGKEIP